MKKSWILAVFLAVVLVGLGVMWRSTWARAAVFSKGVSPETVGFQVAQAQGCFQCHGDWGSGGVPNPGAGKIPALIDFAFTMSIHSESDLLEWILDGAPAKSRETEAGKKSRAVRMPAYRDRLSEGDLASLITFYHGVSGVVYPKTPLAEKGFKTARRLGCFSCHGLGGRFDTPNPGSLVGRIPAWNGPDFEDLARDEGEIREWILDGVPKRLADHPIATLFLDAQLLKMPAYDDLITDEELEEMIAYILWLRDPSAPGHEPDYSAGESESGGAFPDHELDW